MQARSMQNEVGGGGKVPPALTNAPHGNVDTFDPTDHIFVFTPDHALIG